MIEAHLRRELATQRHPTTPPTPPQPLIIRVLPLIVVPSIPVGSSEKYYNDDSEKKKKKTPSIPAWTNCSGYSLEEENVFANFVASEVK